MTAAAMREISARHLVSLGPGRAECDSRERSPQRDAGAHLVRVHDVAEVVAYLDVHSALKSVGAPTFKGARTDDGLRWPPPARTVRA